jgi:hypothetical protein
MRLQRMFPSRLVALAVCYAALGTWTWQILTDSRPFSDDSPRRCR